MNRKLKMQKKKILSDPVVMFLSRHPDADTGKKKQLEELWTKFQVLEKQDKDMLAQTKIICRKIGEAKKNNLPIGGFLKSMQIKSAERKQFKVKLENIEKGILDFFVLNDNRVLPETKICAISPDRRRITCVDKITIHRLDNEESAWNDYVSKQPVATIHHLTQWRNVLQKTYGIESLYFFARDDKRQVVGVLPLARLKSRLFGDLLVSMPYFQRGGAIADHPLIEQKLMQAANEEANCLGIEHIEYRDDVPREGLPVLSHKVNMVISLPGSEDVLWNSFTAKLRAQIKRPQQLMPKVLIGGKEHLADFYKVYARNMRDLGSPGHSKCFVENILDCFPGNSWIIVIRLNNKPVSAGLLLGHGDTLEIPLASTIRKANIHSVNMLLYWEVLKLAIKQDYTHFDFGRSGKNAGTYRFKRQWGAQPKQLYWHYWLAATNDIPSLNPDNPKYALAIHIWKRLPLIITNWLGPLIVKNLP